LILGFLFFFPIILVNIIFIRSKNKTARTVSYISLGLFGLVFCLGLLGALPFIVLKVLYIAGSIWARSSGGSGSK
jgi:predicted membrane channel-forming protein YqfA (hemolysin III family)